MSDLSTFLSPFDVIRRTGESGSEEAFVNERYEMKKNLEDWLKSGAYLPQCIRDFHDAKDLFKTLDEIASRMDWRGLSRPDWVSAQIYVIDLFLWFMARHGYTLQRVRTPESSRPDFYSLEDRLKKDKEER